MARRLAAGRPERLRPVTFGGMASDYQAAWVPEDRHRPYDDAVDLALDWLEQQIADEGARTAVLVTNGKAIDGMPNRLVRFARRYSHTTPRSAHRVQGSRGVPVMAYVPIDEAFELAADLARGSSLVAVEGFATSLTGWANSVGAVDLTGTHQPTPRSPELQEALD